MENDMTILGAWVAVGLTIFVFSFLYRDNPLFKIAENLFIGVSVGYSLTINIFNVWIPKVYNPLSIGDFSPLFPSILGICLLTRFIPKISWVSRFGFAFIVGYGAGLAIPATTATSFVTQIEGTVAPLFGSSGKLDLSGPGLWNSFSVFVLAVGVVATLFYFFFSIEHKGAVQKISKVGIYFLMVYFGAAFGTTVMGRFALLYGRFFDLYTYRTKDYFFATPILIVCLVAFLIFYFRRSENAA